MYIPHITAGGAVASLIMYKMLASLGLKKTFAIYSAIDVVCFVGSLMLIKERRAPSKRPKIIWFDRSFFTDPVFWSLGTCFLFTVLWVLRWSSHDDDTELQPPAVGI